MDCAGKLFRREALEGVRVESGGAFFSAELLIKTLQRGRSIAEVGVPHYPRTAGSPRARSRPDLACREGLLDARLRLWANRDGDAGRADPGRVSCRSRLS